MRRASEFVGDKGVAEVEEVGVCMKVVLFGYVYDKKLKINTYKNKEVGSGRVSCEIRRSPWRNARKEHQMFHCQSKIPKQFDRLCL